MKTLVLADIGRRIERLEHSRMGDNLCHCSPLRVGVVWPDGSGDDTSICDRCGKQGVVIKVVYEDSLAVGGRF
jgi:hypothetical protein